MRKLRLVAVIMFGAYGGHALYKYLSEDGGVFISREKLPESEIVDNTSKEAPVEIIETKTSMDEYFESHKAENIAAKVKENIKEKVEKQKVDQTIEKLDEISAETERIAKEIFNNDVVKKAVEPEPEVEIKTVEIKPKPEKKVEIYKSATKKNCCKHYKAKYCVKIDHSRDNESVNEIIMRHFER